MYNMFVKMRNYLYSHNMLKVYSSAYPVISIGNISSGGSGKTPCALMIAKICKEYKVDVPFLRPKNISTDKSSSAIAIKHSLLMI